MRETISNGCQIMSDGQRVWVNGKSGESIARLAHFRGQALIDIHQPITKQAENRRHCLDCRSDLQGGTAWWYFVATVERHFNVSVGDEHRPVWSR